jgi:serine/threonine protein kinase
VTPSQARAVAPAPPSADDPRVVRALEEYIAAMEAGSPPPRDEFLARHADVAGVLADCLFGLEMVHHAGRTRPAGGPGPAANDDGVAELEPLGDFQIVREVGRGGMGVVYEAVQRSLGRRVALKVLPFAATMDPRQLQRFHNEARAAAGLHHTNIVPVYAVGQERGVHYYAMQFIDGRTLAQLIAEQRGQGLTQVPTMPEGEPAAATTNPPAAQATSAAPRDAAYFKQVAEWGIQAAEALDCAHTLGIVHRDVKPANLLVDATGRLWVTDFGLAQVQSDARLTMTGDLVGTLRYMSLEQALAKRAVIDHRTDVYSLGATLYELLTLEPVFAGTDREELLRQIAFEEPRRARRLNRAIPAELETIVLKALEKNPTERYSTAQELAGDLERWLRDEPIRARRPTLVQRARKWCRRHRPVAAGLAAALAAAVVVAVVMGFWYQQRLADTERGVTTALREAQWLVDEVDIQLLREGDRLIEHPERWQATALRALAAQEKAEELLAAGVATESLAARVRHVRAAVYAAVTDSRLLVDLDRIRQEHVAAVRANHFDDQWTASLYAALLGGYGVDLAAPEAAAARVRDSRLREALLSALADWARVAPGEEERQGVMRVYRRAVLSDSLLARFAAALSRQDRTELLKLAKEPAFEELPPERLGTMAAWLAENKEWAAAEQLLRAGLERHRGDFWLNHELGRLLLDQQPPRPEEAVRYLMAALALRSDSPSAHFELGRALMQSGDADGASRRYLAAARLCPLHKQLNAAAAHFYAEAFAAEPKLADLRAPYEHRYSAACAAALAGCGQGNDAGDLDDTERARLRRQSLTWLRADLADWRKQFEGDEAKFRTIVQRTMQHWLADTDFAGVHGQQALVSLPEAEQQDWRRLWADVEELAAKAGGKSARQAK